MKVILYILLLQLFSCANYIGKIHSDMDNYERNKNAPKTSDDTFAMYRREPTKRPQHDARPIHDPQSYKAAFNDDSNLPPKTRRDYRPAQGQGKRYTASEFVDNESDGSLWGGDGNNNNYLFANKVNKKAGDAVVINVQEDMKNLIANELKKAFPSPKHLGSADKKDADPKQPGAPGAPEAPKAEDKEKEEVTDLNGRVYDKVLAQISEELNNNYVFVSGVKEVLFRKNKHLVRIEGTVSRKFINDEDSIFSEHLLDQRVYILR